MSALMHLEYFYFLLKLLLFVGMGGVIIAGSLYQYVGNKLNLFITMLCGLGGGLYLNTLVLYYYLYFFCNWEWCWYWLILAGVYTFLVYKAKDAIGLLLTHVTKKIIRVDKKILIAGLVILAFFFVGWSYYISTKSITEHDTLEYAVQGNIFYKNRCIRYVQHRYDNSSGFYYVGLHGFSFPLLGTFENITNEYFNSDNLFFRSINSIYGILIVLLVYFIGWEFTDKKYAVLICASMLLNYGFFETIMKYHLDNYRVFFFLLGVYLMYDILKESDKRILVVWSMVLGAQSNIHSLGFMLAIIELIVVFLFMDEIFTIKLKRVSLSGIIMLLSGGLHYVLDIFMGTGWIFKEIKFY